MTAGATGGGLVEVIVRLRPPSATQPRTNPREEVNRVARECGVALEPLDPGATDRELSVYAVARVPFAEAQGIVDRLRRCRGVDAAYIKSSGEPP